MPNAVKIDNFCYAAAPQPFSTALMSIRLNHNSYSPAHPRKISYNPIAKQSWIGTTQNNLIVVSQHSYSKDFSRALPVIPTDGDGLKHMAV